MKVLGWIIFIILLLGCFGFAFIMADFDIKSKDCAEVYGGRVVRGYCTYVENGTSRSFNIWNAKEDKEVKKNG